MNAPSITKYFLKPVRFDYLEPWLADKNIKILDVGCGERSPSLTKLYYPNCEYYGIDITDEGFSKDDIAAMKRFYKMDISKDSFKSVPNNFFDCIIVSHVIEHIKNGEEVIARLLPKLKTNGIIYLEMPAPRSTRLPSMSGTLNFYDDPTHVRIYDLEKLTGLLEQNGFSIIKAGTRRSVKRILLMPVYLIGTLVLRHGHISTAFWDLVGFADYIIAKKVK